MKKKIIIVTALLLISVCGLSVVLSLTDTPEGKYTTMEERVKKEYDYTIAGMADDLQFNYLTMTKYADTIVIARTADHLTAENSVVTQEYREENRASYVKAFSSVRQVDVLATVKGDPDGLLVRQECAKLPTGSVLTYEGCYPMIKGDVYALFLSKQDGADNIGLPLSTDNGLLNLSYLKLNRRYGCRRSVRERFIRSITSCLFQEPAPRKSGG